MITGNRYLVQLKYGALKEWAVLEVSVQAIKVKSLTQGGYSLLGTNEPFWILKSSIDQSGNADYKIVEDLGPIS